MGVLLWYTILCHWQAHCGKVSWECHGKQHGITIMSQQSTLWKSVLGVYWKRKRYRAYFSQLLFCIRRGFSPDNAATRVGSRWSLATATLSSRKRRSPWAETRVNKHPTLTPPPRRGWKKQKNIYTVEYGQKKRTLQKRAPWRKQTMLTEKAVLYCRCALCL